MENYALKIVIILLFTVSGCKSTPKDILSEEKMAEIIVDIKMLESTADRTFYRSIDSTRVAFKQLQKEVYKKHKIDSAGFSKSYDYYLNNKRQFLKVLEKAEKILEKATENEEPGNNTDLQRI